MVITSQKLVSVKILFRSIDSCFNRNSTESYRDINDCTIARVTYTHGKTDLSNQRPLCSYQLLASMWEVPGLVPGPCRPPLSLPSLLYILSILCPSAQDVKFPRVLSACYCWLVPTRIAITLHIMSPVTMIALCLKPTWSQILVICRVKNSQY